MSAAPTRRHRLRTVLITPMVLVLLGSTASGAIAEPREGEPVRALREIRTTYTSEFAVPRPTGIAYDSAADRLLVLGPTDPGQSLIALDRHEELQWSSAIPGSDSSGLVFDEQTGGLTLLQGSQLLTFPDRGTVSDPGSGIRRPLPPNGPREPDGAAFDEQGRLLVLDAARRRIVVLDPESPAALQQTIDLDVKANRLVGLAREPGDDLLYVGAPDERRIYALDHTGEVQAVHDYATDTDVVELRAFVFAPSSDTTDAATTTHLFIAHAGDETTLGGVTEVALASTDDGASTFDAAPSTNVAATAPSQIQLIHTSQFEPASPDPSGVTYWPAADRLLIVDSEVDETTGAGHTTTNLWQLDRQGVVDHFGDTLSYTDEPTGLGFDDEGGRLFISSDDDRGIHILETGPDGLFGTADDVRSFMDVASMGVTDAEDPAFDPTSGVLYFLDGTSTEVYRVDPVNGTFGDGDDQVSHFDVGQFGISDAEALARDPDRGTLLVGDRRGKTVYEITTEAELVQVIDVRGNGELSRISGMTVAPTSTDPSKLSYWIVDRGVDNGSDANENDGRLFEFGRALNESAPAITIDAPQDGTNLVEGETALFEGTAIDVEDGNLTDDLTWTSDLDGVFGTGGAVSIVPSPGTHRITARVTDSSGMEGQASITVHVTGEHGPFTLERAIADDVDDAEESLLDGSVGLGSSDLELGADGATPQRVGMRFQNIDVPFGATVTAASIQFQVDETNSISTDLVIEGQNSGDVAPYAATTGNITSRSRTEATVGWQPPAWTVVGERGPGQLTPDLAPIVQQIIDRPDWVAGNAMAFMVTGTGARTAEATDSGVGEPTLRIEFTTGEEQINTAPRVSAAGDSTFLGEDAGLTSTAVDDGLPDGMLQASWTKRSGPGTVTFDDATASSTTATFDTAGEYELELTVDDGELSGSDLAVLTVVDPAAATPSTVSFGVIGDFGTGSTAAAAVADLITAHDTDFVVTAGDNSYTSAGHDENVGRFYADFIGNYAGRHGQGAALNAFFPAIGDEDLEIGGGLAAYEAFYTLPGGGIQAPAASGNERYYDVVRGPLHVFVLNSNGGEPDGRDVGSVQYEWLEAGLAASDSPWQLVVLHEPPYSSAGSKELMQWPFEAWGADAVISGHHHYYERLQVGGIPYVVNGLGGAPISSTPGAFLAESEVFYNASHGAVLATACESGLTLAFESLGDGVVDTLTLGVACDAPAAPTDLSTTAGRDVVDLEWTDASDDETGFEVERSLDGIDGTFTRTALVGSDVTTHTDTDVSGGLEYCYRVRALGDAGPSAYSDTTCATPSGNAAPVAVDDTTQTDQNAPVDIDVLTNDTDPDGDTLDVGTVTDPTNGTVTINPDQTITYDPTTGFSGTDTFTYTATDGTTQSAPATVTITITPTNNTPIAVDDTAQTDQDAPVDIDVLTNDTDPDGDTLDVGTVTDPTNGTVTINPDQTITYDPTTGFSGTDTFTYTATDGTTQSAPATVTITITPTNNTPIATDDSVTVTEDGGPVTGDVLANDSGLDDGGIVVTLITDATEGTLDLADNGGFSYQPHPDFFGTDSFEYSVCDVDNDCDLGLVTITITAVNDPPVAVDDTAQTDQDAPVDIDVLTNDTDPDGDTLDVGTVTDPTNGTVTINPDQTITYDPTTGFSGTDTFTYTATDGTTQSAPATVTITITPTNNTPIATDDSVTVTEDGGPVTGDVLANDSGLDDGGIVVTLITDATEGTLDLADNGGFSYQPHPDFFGTDSFEYSVCDVDNDCDLGLVTITITAVNDPPVAVDDTAQTDQDAPVDIDVLTNDTDPDGDTLDVGTVTDPTNGTVTINPDQTITYDPTTGFSGTDTFTYTATDGTTQSAPATVTITITPTNNTPIATDDSVTVTEDGGPVTGDVLANDSGLDDGGIVVTLITDATEGTLDLADNGGFSYQPHPDFFGTDSFEYSVCDVDNDCDLGLVTITITAVNDPPVAVDDTAQTDQNAPVDIDVLTNDTDPDGDLDPTSITVTSEPSSGTAVAQGDGTVTYTPEPDFVGTDGFEYSVCDSGGRCDSAAVAVTVSVVTVVDRALSETTVQGSVASGDSTATWASDDVDEVLVERHSGGNPRQRTSALEHHWTFEVAGGAEVAFGVEAHRPENSEGDDFLFAYSTDGGASWNELITIDGAVDADQAVEVALPSQTSGTVRIRVTDTDPATPGNGATDSIRVDELYIVSRGPANELPVVTVTATDDIAGEPDRPGVFRIHRDEAAGELTVTYGLSGDATPDVDYLAPSGSVSFAEGQTHSDVVITPLDDELAEPTEVVVLTIEPGAGYLVGTPSSDSVTITDDDGARRAVFADDEQTVEGNLAGDYAATAGSDDHYETLTEVLVPQGRRSSLDHRWRFSVGTAASATFAVEAHRSTGVDAFSWSYSTDGGSSWTTMNLVTTEAGDADEPRTFNFPAALGGTLWVRVEDTDTAAQESTLDSLFVDQLVVFVE